jgi:regulation of enolase protein 1 (concanavalin A-like superfamily)
MRSRWIWTLAAAVFAAGCDGSKAKSVAAPDLFGTGGWTWIRPDEANRRVEGADLLLKSIPGSLWQQDNTAKNLLLRRLPDPGDPVEVEVTVASLPSAQAEQAGLLWYVDDDHYVKLVREYTDGAVHAVLVIENGATFAVWGEKKKLAAEVTRLKLSRAGWMLTGRFQEGSGAWQEIGSGAAPGGDARIGLFAHGPASGADRWARFSAFRAAPPPK